MNERIKKLAEQAGFQYIKDEGIGWAGNYNASLPKFAELIVRECLTFCEYQGDRFDEYDSGMTERARIIRESIQEHFGLEPTVNETLRNRSTYFENDV
jgi:hypothetical protein